MSKDIPGSTVPRLVARPHQAEAVAAVKAEFEIADRATLVMSVASGKTATGVWTAEAVIGTQKRAVIVCLFPSLTLIRQTIPVWIQQQSWGKRFRFMAVCSDTSVIDDDMSAADMPYPTTTSIDDIARFIDSGGIRVVFATYHSSEAVAAALRETGITCALALFDEAHKTAGSPGRTFSAALDDDEFPCSKRLFMTATPRVTNRKKRDKNGDAQIISMDDESIYGRVAYRFSFRQAKDSGIICGYKVIVSTVTTAELGAAPGDVTVNVSGEQLTLEDAASRVALARAIEMVDARKAITFHSTVADAARFVGKNGIGAMLPAFETYHVNGKQTTQERDAAIDSFAASERGLVSNARCLTEGVDIPAVDLVGFISRKKSKVDIIQAIGRAMRKPYGSDKEVGYVLLPILLDSEKDVKDAMADADLSVMFDVLAALKDEDEVLSEAIKSSATKKSSSKPADLGEFVEVLGASVDMEAVHRAVEVSIVDELAESFDFNIGVLRSFAEREGHARVPTFHEENGINLGRWISNQRTARDCLSTARIKSLEAIPGWSWNAFDGKWEDGFYALKSFADREGHAVVPQKHIENGIQLGVWVSTQRETNESLPLSRRQALDTLPKWTWNALESKWMDGFNNLKLFVEREGHARVPAKHVEGNIKLGSWVSQNRQRRAKLGQDKKSALEQLPGWTWSPIDDLFNVGLDHLKRFVSRNGHARVPELHIEDKYKLGTWVSNRRHNVEKLTPKNRADLEALPGWAWTIGRGNNNPTRKKKTS
jgi:superfamily II DNA or RNA helicase